MNTYESIGIEPVINATGTVTLLGGSLMPPEVVQAWAEASKHFVDVAELQNRVGERIATLAGVEAALVTTGAAGAILLGTAAAVTRGDPQLARRLPDTSGMRNEVILQKSHRSEYDQQIAAVGAKLIEVETSADLEQAFSHRTALLFFMNLAEPDGRIPRDEWISAARQHGVPTLVDAAADVPPAERLSQYVRMGFDLLAISGGKALRGPNDTGLLLGRRDLVEAAKSISSPNSPALGRMMKVGKEDMMALLAAVERFVRLDRAAEWREWEQRLETIERALEDIPGLKCEQFVPPIANNAPHLLLDWDETQVRLTHARLAAELAAGRPSIRIGRVGGTPDRGTHISVLTLHEGEDQVVAKRLREILRGAVASN